MRLRRLLAASVMNAILVMLILGLPVIIITVDQAITYAQTVQYRAAENYMPGVVTIKHTTPDKDRLCLEPPGGGLLVCRPIGEVRNWMFSKAGK